MLVSKTPSVGQWDSGLQLMDDPSAIRQRTPVKSSAPSFRHQNQNFEVFNNTCWDMEGLFLSNRNLDGAKKLF